MKVARILLIPLLFTPLAALAGGGEDCKPTCELFVASATEKEQSKDYKKIKKLSARAVLRKCGPPPEAKKAALTPGANDEFIRKETGDKTYDECTEEMIVTWGQIGPYCAAIESGSKASEQNYIAAGIYTGGAAACWLACSLEKGVITAAAKALCPAAGIAGAGFDIAAIVNLSKEDGNAGQSAANAGTAAAGLASATVSILQTLTGVIDNTAKDSCYGGYMMTVTAGLKWLSATLMTNTADDACKAIKKQGSLSGEFYTGGKPGDGTERTGSTIGSGGGFSGAGSGGSSGGGAGSSLGPSGFDTLNDGNSFANTAAAITANDPMKPILDRIKDPEKIPDLLKKAGTSAGELAATAAGSGGPLAALSSMASAFSPEAQDKLASLDAQMRVEVDKILAGAIPNRGGGGSGGGGGSKSAAPGFAFGAKTPGGPAGAMNFEKQKKADLDGTETTDIWHAGYGGTIFQIVSTKLGKARTRVEELEWASPLNRALTGLGNKANSPARAKK